MTAELPNPSAHLPVVRVSGTPYERGVQYGSAVPASIQRCLERYLRAFAARGLVGGALDDRVGDVIEAVRAYDPACIDEMQGIADGAGMSLRDVVALNARTELLHAQDDGCTTFACLPDVTHNGHTLLGQNWDWHADALDSVVLLHVTFEDGLEAITLVEAGLLSRAGLNSAGIAVVGNFLLSTEDFTRPGVPIPVIRRRLLSSTTPADALSAVVGSPRAFSSNYLIAHESGWALDCEATPSAVFFLEPNEGLITHSNHFIAAEAHTRVDDRGVALYPDTLYRATQLRKRLSASAPEIRPSDCWAALADHFGAPYGICRHLPEHPTADTLVTVTSLVIDITARTISVGTGPTCAAEPYTFALTSSIAALALDDPPMHEPDAIRRGDE